MATRRRKSRKICKKTSKRRVEVSVAGKKYSCRLKKSAMYCSRVGAAKKSRKRRSKK